MVFVFLFLFFFVFFLLLIVLLVLLLLLLLLLFRSEQCPLHFRRKAKYSKDFLKITSSEHGPDPCTLKQLYKSAQNGDLLKIT